MLCSPPRRMHRQPPSGVQQRTLWAYWVSLWRRRRLWRRYRRNRMPWVGDEYKYDDGDGDECDLRQRMELRWRMEFRMLLESRCKWRSHAVISVLFRRALKPHRGNGKKDESQLLLKIAYLFQYEFLWCCVWVPYQLLWCCVWVHTSYCDAEDGLSLVWLAVLMMLKMVCVLFAFKFLWCWRWFLSCLAPISCDVEDGLCLV